MDRPLSSTLRPDHGRNARLTPVRAGPSPAVSGSTASRGTRIRLCHAPQPAARQIAALRGRYGMLARPRTTPSRASQHPRAPTGLRPRQRPPTTLLKTVVDRLAYFLGEVNALHPFREGNGRSQRELFRQIALCWMGPRFRRDGPGREHRLVDRSHHRIASPAEVHDQRARIAPLKPATRQASLVRAGPRSASRPRQSPGTVLRFVSAVWPTC